MPSKPKSTHRRLLTAAVLALVVGCAIHAQVAPAPSTPTAEPSQPLPDQKAIDKDTILLNPFEVDATHDKGYYSPETLNGTRIKSDLKDLGSAMTIFNDQMMDDLGAFGINDILNFAPNTDTFYNSLSDSSGNGNDFINISTHYVTRGASTTTVGVDFFSINGIPIDRYNTEGFTFTRGPNSILFGLGNNAGAFVSSSKRADATRNFGQIEVTTDDRGGLRGTIDANAVLWKNKVAIRYDALAQDMVSYRTPASNYDRRQFITMILKPFKGTTIRLNYEEGKTDDAAIRPWPTYDAATPWLQEGKPLLPAYALKPAKPAGIANDSAPFLVTTMDSKYGTQIPTMSWIDSGISPTADYNYGLPASSTFRSFTNNALYPTWSTIFGGARRLLNFHVGSIFLEQQLTHDWYLEAAVNHNTNRVNAINLPGASDILRADLNSQLPNGMPNPNVGDFYEEFQATFIQAPSFAQNQRVMTSYEYDFNQHFSNFLRWFGHYQFSGFIEEDHTDGYSSNMGLSNVTPLPGFSPVLSNITNTLAFRDYFVPGSGKGGAKSPDWESFPLYFGDTPLPTTTGPGGVTPGYESKQGINYTEAWTKTMAAAMQNRYWNDRIVVTLGLRQDTVDQYTGGPSNFQVLKGADGLQGNPAEYNLKSYVMNSYTARSGNTSTAGVVLHATDWLSFAYNTSDNFQINNGAVDVYGNLLPNPQGKGSDYSVKLALLDHKLYFDVTYYTNQTTNAIDAIETNTAGSFGDPINAIWTAIGTYTGNPIYSGHPYNSVGNVWSDTASTKSAGWEFQATANPTPRWRIVLNGAIRGNNSTSPRGLTVARYLNQYIPFWQANPAWLALNAVGPNSVAQEITLLQQTESGFSSIASLPQSTYTSNFSLNMIQSYEFSPTGPLAGVTIGGNMNLRGPAIDGFAESSPNIFNANTPYYTPNYKTIGAMISYRHRFFRNRVDWRLQLNVRNLFASDEIFPLRTVDSRDGNHTAAVAIWRLDEPRTFQITNTFNF